MSHVALRQSPLDRFIVRLIRMQALPVLGKWIKLVLKWRGTDWQPESIAESRGLLIQHAASGVVVHYRCRIGNNVAIMHNVTIGRATVFEGRDEDFVGPVIEDDCFIGAGAVILGGRKPVVVRRGTVVGANAVLTRSTEPGEIWAGNPARRIGDRNRSNDD